MEPQFPDLPAEVPGVGLADVLGVLGEQADEEIDPAEVAVGQAGEPGPDLRLDLDRAVACDLVVRRDLVAVRAASAAELALNPRRLPVGISVAGELPRLAHRASLGPPSACTRHRYSSSHLVRKYLDQGRYST